MDKILNVTNICWELLLIQNCNTETENNTMKLGGNIFKSNESEYFLLAPKIGHIVKENTEGEKNAGVKKKLYTHTDCKNSKVIIAIAKITF